MKTVKTFSLLFFTAQSSLHPPVKKIRLFIVSSQEKYYSRTYPHKLLLRSVQCPKILLMKREAQLLYSHPLRMAQMLKTKQKINAKHQYPACFSALIPIRFMCRIYFWGSLSAIQSQFLSVVLSVFLQSTEEV